ncbi:MAG TPA: hypothetical protein VMT21_03160 [Gemmatimonadales bacterium]|nr:hypothetical protein [Gemmatimonadales bacterium]
MPPRSRQSLGAALLLLLAVGSLARPLEVFAQPGVASDLWRLAAGTLVVPAALADDGSAALWTPAVRLPGTGASLRLAVEAVHSPSEIGISGGIASVAFRAGTLGTVNLIYGRMGVDGLVRTETSPEAIGGDIAVYNEVLSLGLARAIAPGLTAGIAARALSGRLDIVNASQLGLDLGLRYAGASHFSFGVATRFFDPLLRASEGAASYSAAVSYRTAEGQVWGTTADVRCWYGAGWAHGEGMQHQLSAGLALGGVAELDVGAAREETAGIEVWRSRLGVSLDVGRYRVYLGRDGGVNGFGASYRFGLAAGML